MSAMTAMLVLLLLVGVLFGGGLLTGWVLRDARDARPPATLEGWSL